MSVSLFATGAVRRANVSALMLLFVLATGARGDASQPAGPAAAAAEARAHAYMVQQPPDWDAAREAFVEAAEGGSPTAMSYVGWLYEQGHGVAADPAQALAWYARAAEAGAHDFAVKVGWMYLGGNGVAASRESAEIWFLKAIDAGHAPGKVALASLLIADAQGGRAPERISEARAMLEQALEVGLGTAAFFLARLYIEGVAGHPVDPVIAAHYTRLGANDGNSQMQGWLAIMYLQGRGVEPDRVAAAKWASLAAAGGDPVGKQVRQLLQGQLAPAEAQAAQERARKWARKWARERH